MPDLDVNVSVWHGFADVAVLPFEAAGMSWVPHGLESITATWQRVITRLFPTNVGDEAIDTVNLNAAKKFLAEVVHVPGKVLDGHIKLAKKLSPYALGILGCYGIGKLLAYGVDRALRLRTCDIWRHVSRTDQFMIENMVSDQHPLQQGFVPFCPERDVSNQVDALLRSVHDDHEGWFEWTISLANRIVVPRLALRDWNTVVTEWTTTVNPFISPVRFPQGRSQAQALADAVQHGVGPPIIIANEVRQLGLLNRGQRRELDGVLRAYNDDLNAAQLGFAPPRAVPHPSLMIGEAPLQVPFQLPPDVIDRLDHDEAYVPEGRADGWAFRQSDVYEEEVYWTAQDFLVATRNVLVSSLITQPLALTLGLVTLPWRMLDRSGSVQMLGARIDGMPRVEWDHSLIDFLQRIGLPQCLVDRWNARMVEKTTRNRIKRKLLRERDLIFKVRGIVMSKIGREQLRNDNEANRLVVSRCVSTVMQELNLPLGRRAMINDACIEACFIDTMYDVGGQELLLGPSRRPV